MPAALDAPAAIDTPDVEDRVRSCLALVFHIARKFSHGRPDLLEELIAEGNVALVVAARAFDGRAPWPTFASVAVERRMLTALASRRHRPWAQLPQFITEGGDSIDVDPEDFRPDPTCAVEVREQVAALLRVLPRRWRRTVELFFGLAGHRPHSLPRVAAALGIAPSTAQRLLACSLRRLRRAAGVREPGQPSGLDIKARVHGRR
jgi:RNA polymerase sigma factor (sigma-70 family)